MMWIDHHLRRVGPLLLILGIPAMVIPVIVVSNLLSSGDGSSFAPTSMTVLIGGWIGSVGLFVALLLLTIRAFRRPIWVGQVAGVDAWVEDAVAELAHAEVAQADLDHLVDLTDPSRRDLVTMSLDVLRELIEHPTIVGEGLYVELAIPLADGIDCPSPGSRDLDVLTQLRYPPDLRGVRIPGYALRRVAPKHAERLETKTQVLTTEERFARPVFVEHLAELSAEPGEELAWVRYIVP